MKKIEKLPRGLTPYGNKYRIQFCVKGQRYSKVSDNVADLVEYRDQIRERPQEGTRPKPVAQPSKEGWTLKEGVEKTFELIWNGRPSVETNTWNSQAALNFFGPDTYLADIGINEIDAYAAYCMKMGNSGGTVNRKLSCLSRILRTAYERDKLKSMPRIPRKRETEHRIRFLSPEEEKQLVKTLFRLGYSAQLDAVFVLIYTGFRCSEVWKMEKRDLSFEQGTITTWKTKSSKPRTVPMLDTIRPLLERRCEGIPDTGKVFPEGSNEWLRNAWERAREVLNMKDDPQFVPHMLRHTCATRLAQGGASMVIIKQWMGHADITTTSRYTHFAPSDLQNAAGLLSAVSMK